MHAVLAQNTAEIPYLPPRDGVDLVGRQRRDQTKPSLSDPTTFIPTATQPACTSRELQ